MATATETAAAVEFLHRWNPNGPWVLTAIESDRSSINTETLTSLEKVREFIHEWNGRRNIYFTVNSVIRAMRKKPERTDIKALGWLHVDIDPDPNCDLEQEREKILTRLTDKLPKDIPPPSVIIFSGGGYQAFWRLANPLDINGVLNIAEEAKLYNQYLETVFGGDNCHNVDRIMRVPGTWNIPDQKKLDKGRTKILAEVIEFNDTVYDLDIFKKSTSVGSQPRMRNVTHDNAHQVNVDVKKLRRLVDVHDLNEWNVSDRVKLIIQEGYLEFDPKPDGRNSRSEWLLDAVCHLIRANVPDAIIYSVITDPNFKISESVLEVKDGQDRYARRQIERGHEYVSDPKLLKLNDRYAVLRNYHGKCRIIEEQVDPAMNRTRLTFMTRADFENAWCNHKIEFSDGDKIRSIPMGKWWFENTQRRTYDTIVFVPGQDVGVNNYNLWSGFAYTPAPGDCGLYLQHAREVICRGNEEHYEYLLNWMARAVQRPDLPGETAIVIRGGRGHGKSIFAKEFGTLFGRHYMEVSNERHLTGNFNAHLQDVVFLFADEAFYAGDPRNVRTLNHLITSAEMVHEKKGVDAVSGRNFIHLMIASNEIHVVPAAADERRYMVLDTGEEKKKPSEYFVALINQMENGGRAALLDFLMSRDISDFRPQPAPQSDAMREQKMESLSPVSEWWRGKLEDGSILPSDSRWPEWIDKQALTQDFVNYADSFRISRRGSASRLFKELRLLLGRDLETTRRRSPEGVRRVVRIPTLEQARAEFDRVHQVKTLWSLIDDETPPPQAEEQMPF